MFRKKFIISAVSLSLAASSLTGCGSGSSSKSGVPGSGDGLKIVCTIFPEYDWVKEILGSHADSADVTYLLDSGTDLHSYQPTADDILQISTCDIFVYVGGESEKWVDDALNEAVNKDMKVISLMDVLGDSAKEEELKEGMQGEEEEEEEKEEETEYDEHVWLSLNNAKLFCNEIESALEAADPDNSADYRSELESYISELDSLDSSFRSLFESSSAKTLVFGDR